MSYSKIEGVYLSAVAVASTDVNGPALDVREKLSGSVVVIYSGAAATDATFKLQESWDGTTWSDVSGATMTLSVSGATTQQIKIPVADVNMPLLRGVTTKASETTAVMTVRYYFKGAR